MAVINGLSDNYEVLVGTPENDTLKGGKGNDAINGENGQDTAVYSGNASDYSFQATSLSMQITDLSPEDGDEGEDYLTGIEFIQFADRTFQISPGGQTQANNTENGGSPSTVILADGGWLVAWDSGIQRYDSMGNPVDTAVPLEGYDPFVSALPDGGWLATYKKIGSGYDSDIFVCRYDAQGQPQGSAILVDSHSSISSLSITVLDNGEWLASWQAGSKAFIQRFDEQGQSLGEKAQINTTDTAGLHSVCPLPDGGWLVTWNGFKSGTGREIFLQRYDSAGQEIDGEVRVSEGGAAYIAPSTALLSDGSWIVSWWSEDANYSGHLHAQRFDAQGAPLGDVQALSAPIFFIRDSSPPSVAALPDGGWVAAWCQGPSSDTNMNKRVHLQRFDREGNPIGDEFAYTAGNLQYAPQLDVLPDGGWILTWHSGPPTEDVFFQRFDAQGAPYLPVVQGTDSDDYFRSDGEAAFAGGAGDDTYDITSSNVRITEENGAGEDTVRSTASYELPDHVEYLILTGSADVSGFGNEQANVIVGNDYNNVIRGDAGNDTLDGASGSDTADYQNSNAGIDVSLDTGLTHNDGFGGIDTLISIENITGSIHADHLAGDENINILIGNQGNDLLSGGGGNDKLIGGTGQDTAVYSGNAEDYMLGWSNGYLTVTDLNLLDGDDGSDQLREVENLQFSNQSVAVGTGGIVRTNTTTDIHQNYPLVAGLNDGGWLVIWNSYDQDSPLTTGIFSQRYDVSGKPIGEETQVNSTEKGHQNCNSAISLADGGWLITWSGQGADDNYGIFYQRYNSDGQRVGTETLINTNTTGNAGAPIATLLADGGWLLAWCDNPDGRDNFFAQRFNAAGDRVGNEIQLSDSSTIGLASSLDISATPEGGWMVSWYDNGSTYIQQYGANGTATSQVKRVNDDPFSSISRLSNGDWLLTYEGSSSTDFTIGLHAQYLDSLGQPKGNSVLIAANGSSHEIVTLTNGDLLLVWDEAEGLRFQRLDNSGNRLGSASVVQHTGPGDNPVITPLVDGGWIVAWQAETLGSADIYTQRYDAQGKPLLLEISGSSSNDTLNGTGPLLLLGGYGNDTYKINSAQTEVRESENEGTDIILSYIKDYALGSNIENGRIMAAGSANLTGNVLNNALYAGIGNNVLTGGSGIDTVSYQYASSAITASLASTSAQATGGSGSDTLIEIENLSGSSYNDRLTGNSANNILSGGLGNDILNGGAGADNMIGGDGSDIYYVDNAGDLVDETNNDANIGGTDTVYSYLANYNLGIFIENGRIMAVDSANLTGNALNNILYAGVGNNVLTGGSGVDTVSYKYASSAIKASLASTSAQATGGSGSDTLIDIENLSGSSYNDELTGNTFNNKLSGGLGNDILNGGVGADNMIGGDGSDTYYVENVGDLVNESNTDADIGGSDTVYSYLTNYNLGANIENGHIMLEGSANLTGNSLNNILYAGIGNNVLAGGSGTDTVSYQYAGSAITASLASSSTQATGGSGSDSLSDIENLSGSNHNDSLTGNSANNKLSGGAGNDVLNGGAGVDNLIGGDGSDTYFVDNIGDVVSETNANLSTGGNDIVYSYLSQYSLGTYIENGRVMASGTASLTGNSLNNILYAGAGNNVLNGSTGSDTVSYRYASSAVTASLASTTAQATGGSGSDTFTAIENLTGSDYHDKLTGNSAGNKLSGGLGNDVLNGGAGADNMIGDDGSDTYYVDHISDVVSETNADIATGGTDTVYSYLSSFSLGANIDNGRILASGAANLTGNGLNNVLMAGSGNNVLNGGEGADIASYAYASAAVAVNLSKTGEQVTGGSGSDTLISIESLIGSNYHDSLIGNSAGNILNGGSGNDRLIGGAGKDILIGGAGNDIFAFNALSDTGPTGTSCDVINDFIRGADKIDLSKLDANTTVSGDNAFTQVITGTAAFTAAGQLKVSNGVLYGNTDADVDAEFAIELVGISSVSLADFIA